ncbi:cobalt-precorrin-5B (C(1))-methyltransferase [Candidatus Marithrix sp. Canyon 246]|uniref:cobalt-precorrin-5B (C(1))-methyltransferase n=1 Tax=Candidatus Marithrix sp. Canyon 246 TaxID=1827136 RepID=UPI000849F4C7|nr:cobalt-precorrin-5B (C(1))-methyltransferase [Candidatus Marithrix sp. Canyon 246]
MVPKRKKKGNRKGFSTGANAAAAALAATEGLVTGKIPQWVDCVLPENNVVKFEIIESYIDNNHAFAMVIKDAGDDPDVTNKAQITADVRILPNQPKKLVLKGGKGVGIVTQEGLGLEVGGAAINPKPREYIEQNVRLAAGELLDKVGLEVTISVPEGEKIAKRTLNSRLGILNGISILGTTGIVHPWSTAAFRASVIQGIEVTARQGHDTVVLTTGGRTEKFVMRELPELPQGCFVQMGDFLRYALDTVVKQKIKNVIIGGMVGKLTKIAQGETITHAGRNPVNMELVASLAKQAGAPQDIVEAIKQAQTARFASEQMQQLGITDEFYKALAAKVISTLMGRYPEQFNLTILICDFEGNKINETYSKMSDYRHS